MPEAIVWEKQAPVLWSWYTQLVHVEEAFKTLKSDLVHLHTGFCELRLGPLPHGRGSDCRNPTRSFKCDAALGLRPIHHQIERRVEAHIFVAFLAYCLTVTLRMRLKVAAPGLTPRAVLKSLSAIQLVDVHVPITDGRELVMPRYTEPEAQQAMILEKLNLRLPKQPPPRIRSGEIIMPPDSST